MLKAMADLRQSVLSILLAASAVAVAQQPVAVQKLPPHNGAPSSGGYQPSALSTVQLLQSDPAMNEALLTFVRTGNRDAYRTSVLTAAQNGNLAAELILAGQYIPEQCTFEPNQDAPHCGKAANEPPRVTFRANPLGVEASYEEAAKWLEKASAQGSGEASEILAQLITRMLANQHSTHYTGIDSARFHRLARSQGFDVEAVVVTCYKRVLGGDELTVGRLPGPFAGRPPLQSFTSEELVALRSAGITGSLLCGGASGPGDSVLLSRPEGPVVNVRVILDHDPGVEILLPLPAHHDEIYVQRGNDFLAFPSGGKVLPRFINLEPQTQGMRQVSMSVQLMDGAHSGGFCTQFP